MSSAIKQTQPQTKIVTMHYHILNGDALNEQFQEEIGGQLIVCRECLVEGDVSGENLNEVCSSRKDFFSKAYKVTNVEYDKKSYAEFLKIINIPKGSNIDLWFEYDLFCQVNLWFVIHLINQHLTSPSLFLIRPIAELKYGFGGMEKEDLKKAFYQKMRLQNREVQVLSKLWLHYQNNDFIRMEEIATDYMEDLPFLLPVVLAHKERFPQQGMGKLQKIMKEILTDLDDPAFEKVFRIFQDRTHIYGFGDSQVKRIYDEVISHDS